MILGGVVISALGAGSTVFVEEKQPSVKSLSRDFIIGALMVAFILQLLPESGSSVIEWVLGLIPLSLLSSVGQKGGGDQSGITMSVTGAEEMEVKVGVPGF